jgi:type I restriction enzyme, S subunit
VSEDIQEHYPSGWVWSSVGEVIEPIVEQGSPNNDKEFLYVDIGSIDNRKKKIVEPKVVPTSQAPSRAKQHLEPNDVLVSMTRPNLNAVALLPDSMIGAIGSTGFHILRSKVINPSWLFYLVQTNDFIDAMSQVVQGALYPAVRPKDINGYKIPLAPLAEQNRIVEEIEKHFTRLDAAVTGLKRVQANLKRYRASVLKAACEGRLVPTEAELAKAKGREYEPADQLLSRILKERRAKWEADQLAKMQAQGKVLKDDKWKEKYEEPSIPEVTDLPNLPEGWLWATVEQLSIVVRGASPRPAGHPKYFGGTIPWITVGSLTADKRTYLHSVTESLTEAGREASRYIDPDTLLLTNSGATLGVPKITLIGGCINDGSVALLYLDYPLKLYLYFYLTTQTKKLRAINQGAAQPNLNTSIVKAICIPLPPLEEQERINAEVERRLSIIEELEAVVASNLKRAERLRQSILKRAFEGKLVPQDPTDEPAGVLLERIKGKRERKEAEEKKGRLARQKKIQPKLDFQQAEGRASNSGQQST